MAVRRVDFGSAPESIPRFLAASARVEPTVGDGACAVHSVFGTPSQRGYAHPRPRQLIQESFEPTWRAFVARLDDDRLRDQMKNMLLLDVIKPFACKDVGVSTRSPNVNSEECKVWQEVKRNPKLLETCHGIALEAAAANKGFHEHRLRVVKAFQNTCISSLKDLFVRPLLNSLDLLDGYSTSTSTLECSKLEALFLRHEESQLYCAAVVESCGLDNFDVLRARVADIVEGSELPSEFQAVLEFVDIVTEACAEAPWRHGKG